MMLNVEMEKVLYPTDHLWIKIRAQKSDKGSQLSLGIIFPSTTPLPLDIKLTVKVALITGKWLSYWMLNVWLP